MYEKENIIIDINDDEKNIQLIDSIIEAQKDLKKANINFEFAEDELIDFYAYQIKALQSKLDYLIRIAKLKKIEHNFCNENVI